MENYAVCTIRTEIKHCFQILIGIFLSPISSVSIHEKFYHLFTPYLNTTILQIYMPNICQLFSYPLPMEELYI